MYVCVCGCVIHIVGLMFLWFELLGDVLGVHEEQNINLLIKQTVSKLI